jgi:hypothetical protein
MKSLDSYFIDKGTVKYFNGKKMELLIPKRYSNYEGCLQVEDTIKTLAILNMKIDGKDVYNLLLPAIIEMDYSEVAFITDDDGIEYVKVTLYKGDRFMVTTDLIPNDKLGYIIYYEFIYIGNYPKGVSYNNCTEIFDSLTAFIGLNFKVDHAVLEIILAQLHRDSKKINELYRLSDMKDEPYRIPMKDSPHAARSVTGRLVGNYLNDNLDSIIVNKTSTSSEIENILRA